ncbi:hypothetical protein LQK80_32490 [Bacillus thuringiensis]|nr:hypothetical protein [Bacillus thuringiensis]
MDWCVFVIPMTFWVFPAQARMGLIEAITYLFSLDFYTEPTVSTNIVSGMQNKTYLLLNIGKVILWIWTIIIVLRFLFKNLMKLNLSIMENAKSFSV